MLWFTIRDLDGTELLCLIILTIKTTRLSHIWCKIPGPGHQLRLGLETKIILLMQIAKLDLFSYKLAYVSGTGVF